MHITTISSFPLQCQWLSKQMSDNGLQSTQINPENFKLINYERTDALFFPHFSSSLEIQGLKQEYILEKGIPIIFWGKCPNNYPSHLREHSVFLPKQLQTHELCLVIKELIGRNYKQRYGQKIQIGDYTLQRETRTLLYKEEKIRLTRKEYQLLELLILNAGQITTRRHIVNYVWDSRTYVSPNTIDVYISRLRKKLRGFRSSIRTINSLGYELVLPTTH